MTSFISNWSQLCFPLNPAIDTLNQSAHQLNVDMISSTGVWYFMSPGLSKVSRNGKWFSLKIFFVRYMVTLLLHIW